MIIIKMFVLLGLYSVSRSQNLFMPNLPLGEYRIALNKVYHCDSTKNQPLQFNVYFSKKTSNITELKGNFTFLIPIDNTLILDVNLSSWGLIGGWIPNAYIFITKKACSNTKKMLGNAWLTLLKGFNFPNENCPVSTGIYQTSGIDLKLFENHNFPKIYFYGKYKMVIRFKNKENNEVDCENLEFTLLRPWETPT